MLGGDEAVSMSILQSKYDTGANDTRCQSNLKEKRLHFHINYIL